MIIIEELRTSVRVSVSDHSNESLYKGIQVLLPRSSIGEVVCWWSRQDTLELNMKELGHSFDVTFTVGLDEIFNEYLREAQLEGLFSACSNEYVCC